MWKDADSDCGPDVQVVPGDAVWRTYDGEDFFDLELQRLVFIDLRKQQNEFVATKPTDCVCIPDGTLEAIRDRLQQLVADCVPMRIVDELEPIEIQEQDRQFCRMSLCYGNCLIDSVVELNTVRQAGKKIVSRQLDHFRLYLLALGGLYLQPDGRNDQLLIRQLQGCIAFLLFDAGHTGFVICHDDGGCRILPCQHIGFLVLNVVLPGFDLSLSGQHGVFPHQRNTLTGMNDGLPQICRRFTA